MIYAEPFHFSSTQGTGKKEAPRIAPGGKGIGVGVGKLVVFGIVLVTTPADFGGECGKILDNVGEDDGQGVVVDLTEAEGTEVRQVERVDLVDLRQDTVCAIRDHGDGGVGLSVARLHHVVAVHD